MKLRSKLSHGLFCTCTKTGVYQRGEIVCSKELRRSQQEIGGGERSVGCDRKKPCREKMFNADRKKHSRRERPKRETELMDREGQRWTAL